MAAAGACAFVQRSATCAKGKVSGFHWQVSWDIRDKESSLSLHGAVTGMMMMMMLLWGWGTRGVLWVGGRWRFGWRSCWRVSFCFSKSIFKKSDSRQQMWVNPTFMWTLKRRQLHQFNVKDFQINTRANLLALAAAEINCLSGLTFSEESCWCLQLESTFLWVSVAGAFSAPP